jgi:hypothetical protein
MSGVSLCHFFTLPLRIHHFKWSGATIPLPDVPKPQTGIIVGTGTDVNDDTVPGATVVLEGPVQTDPRTVVTNGNRFFEFKDVEPGTNYHVTVSAQGFANWTSPAVILKPGQYAILTGSKLHIAEALTTITVAAPVASPEEMAAEQVKAEEQQRIFGIIPNFYVVYDHDAAPLTTKLNSSSPPMSFSIRLPSSTLPRLPASSRRQTTPTAARVRRVMLIALARAMPTALSTSWSGALSYHRFCTRTRATSTRAGAQTSHALHPLSSSFICRGDNGRLRPNYSTIRWGCGLGGPRECLLSRVESRVGLFLGNLLINTGQRATANLTQELILRRLTPKAKNQTKTTADREGTCLRQSGHPALTRVSVATFTLRAQLSPDRRGEIPPGMARLDSHSLSKPPTHL